MRIYGIEKKTTGLVRKKGKQCHKVGDRKEIIRVYSNIVHDLIILMNLSPKRGLNGAPYYWGPFEANYTEIFLVFLSVTLSLRGATTHD